MISKEDIYEIGKFQKTHALKGELNIILDIDPDYFIEGNPLIVETAGIFVPFYVESIRPKGHTSYLMKLSGIDSEEEASAFVNQPVFMLQKDKEDWLDEDEEELDALIGYMIIDAASKEIIGKIEKIEDSTENILWIVEDKYGEEIFLPATEEFIVTINDEIKEIMVNLPDGLLDLNRKEIKGS